MFSKRLPEDLRPNAIARRLGARGAVPFDLTVSNPTACDLPYPARLLHDLSDDGGLRYRPDPRGLESARRAVARDYLRHGVEVDPSRIVLTASTSEAYTFLFKLLCDPGDEALVPVPSYPLFEHLASLEGVRPVRYRLDPHDGWQPAIDGLAAGRPRMLLAVHPNNPTGSFLSPSMGALVSACAGRGMALVVDEVFLDYPLDPRLASQPSFADTRDVLAFTLGGLSKSVGLPQLKLSWIAVSGPPGDADEAVRRLEFISDNFLSVATPVQIALPRLLAEGASVRDAILRRCRANLATLRSAVGEAPGVAAPAPEGGWGAIVRYPAVIGEEALALELLEQDGVAVHPGYFFDFAVEGCLVVSLLPEPAVFCEGVRRLVARIATHLRA